MLNIPWISPELELWKRRPSSKRLSPGWVTAPSQAFLQCPDRMEPGTGPAADRQPPAPHSIPSLPPSWLGSKASGWLCLGGFTFHCRHLPTKTGRGGGGGERGMAMEWWIAGSHGKRAGECRQGLQREGRGQKQQSQALVPDVDLWPACSCSEENHGFKSVPLWQAPSYSSAFLCYALHSLSTSTKPSVFWRCFVRMDSFILISPL